MIMTELVNQCTYYNRINSERCSGKAVEFWTHRLQDRISCRCINHMFDYDPTDWIEISESEYEVFLVMEG